MNNTPAIMGGKPLFQEKLHIVRPVLPQLDEMSDDIQGILSSGMVTKGRFLIEFENAVAQHLGVNHVVAVSSCTTGLMLTYQALGLDGDVIVPSFTFMATVSALVWNNLHPVFSDVNPDTTNLEASEIEEVITPQTTAIVAVHNFGNPADIEVLQTVAHRHGLKLIFDAAHGFGALYRGLPVGKQGDAQVFSLSPTKLLISGEGGIVATNDDALAEKIRIGREYGNSGSYDSAFAGLNARMPEFNALLGLRSLGKLENAALRRNEIASLYQEILGSIPGVAFQEVRPGNRSSYKDFSITIDANGFGLTRDELALALAAENVDTRKYYEPPVHRQAAYQHLYSGRLLPNTEWLASNSLSFPIWSHMQPETAMGICEAVKRINKNAPAVRKQLAA